MTFPILPRAPIVEGLIDIQAKPRQGISLNDLVAFGDRIKSSYPTVKDLREIKAQIPIGQDSTVSPAVAATLVGYRFERQSPPFVVHARVEELLVSRLKPYDTWDNLLAEAKSLWREYCEICKPEVITRIATRYINRIELPMEKLDFDDYLAAPPLIPKGLPQTIEHFLTRIVVPDKESGAHVAISQVLDAPNPQTRTIPVLIDIDVYKETDLPVGSDELWIFLGKMRDLKNKAFFDSVRDKALELFR